MNKSKLMELKKMNGTDKLAEALMLRGFLVKVDGEFIVFEKGRGYRDLLDAKMLLDQLNIPVFWQQDRFQLLTLRFPVGLMKKIIRVRGRGHEVWMRDYHYKWKSFVQRRYGVKTNALDLDSHTAVMVKALNQCGITTLAGCNGHHRYAPNFQFSGAFNGAWFEIVQERYLSELNLHYKWEVGYKNRSGSNFYAIKQDDAGWKMQHILEDCVQMAQVLVNNSEEIRELKQKNFKRKKLKEEAQKFVSSEQKVDWLQRILRT